MDLELSMYPKSRTLNQADGIPWQTKPMLIWPAVAACLLLTACGGGGDDSSSDVGDTPSPVAEIVETEIAIEVSDQTGNPAVPVTPVEILPLTLTALPTPPLTEAPGANAEPISEGGNLHSVTGFLPVINSGERIPEKEPVNISLEDFLAGPLEPQIQVPAGVDVLTNAAPFFEGLEDQEVIAGQQLSVRFDPRDPDGGLPGMFPEEVPEGGQFVDNFDGTKSLVWTPLQGDVGIREFTAVAIDPLDSQYRTRQTIRIRIQLPDDPSAIPNRPPRIEAFLPHTVRVNDPVAIELKGRDLNDTVPVLSIADLPVGATFTQHPQFEEVYVLRFVPVETGIQTFTVVSIDAADPNVTNSDVVSIEVLAEEDFEIAGSRLRTLAENRDFKIGFASRQEFYHRPDGEIYAITGASEFNLVTPENSLKMDLVNPLPGRYRFADADNLVTYAAQNDMQIHGHPLIWYTQVPEWVEDTPTDEREIHMREYITRVLERYQDSITLWDIVNEPMDEDGSLRNSVWFQGMGESYIDVAFVQAREILPEGTLILNDYDIEINGPKADGFFSLIERMQLRGTPLDAVGFQMHLFSTFDRFDEVRENFQRAADLGLDLYVTELDVSFPEGSTDRDLQLQADVYREILSICLEQERCKALQTWGFTDQYSWREPLDPLMFDARYQPKPAYFAIQQRLSE